MIAKLDSGHRGSVLSIAELIVIAAALDVPPIALLYPELPDGMVEVVPGESISSIDAVRRFAGEERSGGSDGARLLLKSRELAEVRHRHERLDRHIERMIERAGIAKGETASQAEKRGMSMDELISAEDKLSQLEADLGRIPGAVLRDHA
ncbi:hypothetical protein AVZ31_22885 [Mycolicibacterium neoaurum]|nr:hypothetical protein DXK33_05915 [Mycolicibacterium neoaurum]KUM06133.1 hypothetical protein AVZ31_22885 [Mycolicibacterium neoaurum]